MGKNFFEKLFVGYGTRKELNSLDLAVFPVKIDNALCRRIRLFFQNMQYLHCLASTR